MYAIEYQGDGVYVCLNMSKKPCEDGRVFAVYDPSDPNCEYASVTDFCRVCLAELWEGDLLQDCENLSDFELSDMVMLAQSLEKPAGGVYIDNWVKTQHGYGYA